ncbi:M20 aminoacylase family protein [Herbaspirillum sp. RTI4]|uniref:M20 aminoacylase family protein n=1 Tax=Herbaspirillum sp. RTI4 TaxID=3048640 RepID=UPI002AB42468|nr:M20 aminoacylase family protein [Herbaspirillum sp. RTI4]MDY7577655.1 M20 aminoacylase family protein [Herbaspirillum sp. RTI4]MEA9982179.1 M20 aminoacylase family protein [Herbaspirillum sp. RTI4]
MNLIKALETSRAEFSLIRRDLHAHPELSFEEQRTSDIVAAQLERWDIPVHRGLGGTGVVGVIRAGTSKRAIGLRADMDALPIQETNTFSHASQHAGKMHACGHDGHTAMLLAAAWHLNTTRQFDGTVYVIFQPAEEKGGGAAKMIEDGLFDKFAMESVYGLHNWPGMPLGVFGVKSGAIMASSSSFKITLHGKGSHAALPHNAIDPVAAMASLAQALQTILTRNKKPSDAAVLSITQMHAGDATNVIPDFGWLGGTVRTFSNEVLDLIEIRLRALSEHLAHGFGCEAEIDFDRNYPPTINHPDETAVCVEVMRALVGADKVDADIEAPLSAEDFSFMLQEKPGCYALIGNGDGGHRDHGHGLGPCMLHNTSYDFNDDLLPIGASYWVKLAERLLPA